MFNNSDKSDNSDKSELIQNIENKYNIAIHFFQSEKYKESEEIILEILELIPDNSDVYNFYGRLKQFQGDFNKSIELLKKSVEYDPKNFMAHYNLGLAYCIKKDLINVKKHFTLYQNLNPDENDSKYVCNLYISKLHFDELDITETKEFYQKSRVPLFVELSQLLVPRIYKSSEEINYYRNIYLTTLEKLLSNNIDHLIVSSEDVFCEYLQFIYCYVFPLSYQGENNRKILELQCQLYRKIFPCLNYTSKYINDIGIINNKIKIGFISTNFFNQSVSRDRMGIIRNLPRELFDVTVFFYFKPSDDLGNFIWDSDNTNIVLPDTNIFERRRIIEEQKLNILIYCDIGMAPDTYFLSFSRLAPVQCNTWGHSDTSGIDTIDYYLSSIYYEKDYVDGHPENNYSEKLVLMDSLCTYYYKIIENATVVNKNYFGFSNETNIYLSSQVLFKLNPNYDKVINQILENDPNGIVVFIKMNIGSYIQDTLINRLEKTLKHNMTRFHLVEWQTSERDFYKLLSIADVIIDPYPFGGCNTSFSAFSMGIPIVTMPADMINGRFTYGLYKKMGIMDLVAYNFDDYVKLAIKCATNKPWRDEISERIKSNIHLIFNEVDSINSWINFCIDAVNNNYSENPIVVPHTNKFNNNTPQIELDNIDNTEIDTILVDTYNKIPKILHFIYFGYTDFTFIHYLSIKTAYDHNPTYKIYLYNYNQPVNNLWWNLTLKLVETIHTEPPQEIFGNTLNNYAHKADIIRLTKLIEYGGIYLDIDIWTIKSYDDLLDTSKSCVMGFQASNTQFEGLCNAVICSKPQSEFLKIWLENYKTFDNSQWDNHSVHLPLELSKKHPDLIEIKSQEAFFPVSWWEFEDLFKKSSNHNISDSYCIHLWESHLMDKLLSKLSPIYFHIFDTPMTRTFKDNLIYKNKPHLLYILENNSNLSTTKNYLHNLLSQGFEISITYMSNLLNEQNSIISNPIIQNIKDDLDICINNLYQTYNIDTIDTIITNVTVDKWSYLQNKFQNKSIYVFNEYKYNPSDISNDLQHIAQFITPYHINIDSTKVKVIDYPYYNMNNLITHKIKYNANLYEKLDKSFSCAYNDNIIKIDNIFIENYKCIPLSNVKSDKIIFYTVCTLNNSIFSLIDCYYSMCQNKSNILLYIIGLYNDDTLSILEKIKDKYKSYPILFNFNYLNSSLLEPIHKKCHCYIDIENSPVKYDVLLWETPIILFENDKIIENTYLVNKIQNQYDLNHMIHNMGLIYEISNNKIEKTKKVNDKLLENYISSSVQLNSIFEKTNKSEKIIEKKSKSEILMIGKFSTFKNRMDTSYYELLNHIQESSDYKIVFVDSKSCEINKPLSYYIDKYCETTDPIIYNIVYTDKSEQIINDLEDSKLITIYEIEDCYEVDNVIYNINTFKYDYVIYRYNCEQMNYIISKCNTKFIHYPHFINTNIFRQQDTEKTIDILLYGNTSNFYPFRQRLFNLIKKSGLNYYYLPHPGYNEYLNEDNPNKIIGSELSQLINKAKITISTCSSFNYLLKKYIEISLSGSIIAGNYPTTEENIYKNCMCLLDETDTDEVIIEKIKNILNLSKKDYNHIIKESYKISIENHSYTNAIERFNKIIYYICNN